MLFWRKNETRGTCEFRNQCAIRDFRCKVNLNIQASDEYTNAREFFHINNFRVLPLEMCFTELLSFPILRRSRITNTKHNDIFHTKSNLFSQSVILDCDSACRNFWKSYPTIQKKIIVQTSTLNILALIRPSLVFEKFWFEKSLCEFSNEKFPPTPSSLHSVF